MIAKNVERNIAYIKTLEEKIAQKQNELRDLKDKRDKVQNEIISSMLKNYNIGMDELINTVSKLADKQENKDSEKTPENSAEIQQSFSNRSADNKKAGEL